MIVFIVILLLGILALIGGGTIFYAGLGNNIDDKPHPGGLIFGSLIFLAGVVLVLSSFGFKEIGAGEVGVVTSFGKVEQGTLGPGLNWRLPIVQNITTLTTRVQNYNFGAQDTDGNKQEDGIEAFTQEQQPAFLFGVVNYHIDPQFASDLYQRVGTDYFDKVIHSQSDTELKQDARLYKVEDITSKRDELAKTARDRLARDVEQYHIIIDGIFISQIGLSPEYLASVEAKQISQQKIETAKNDAEAAKQTAIGQANAAREAAKGQADANASVTASLSDILIRWQAIQKLNPNVNVMLVPENGNFLFNLPGASPAP